MRRLIVLLLAALCATCGPTVEIVRLNQTDGRERSARIEVLDEIPARPYIELGIIRVSGCGATADRRLSLIKRTARAIGADVVIVGPLTACTRGEEPPPPPSKTGVDWVGVPNIGVAIIWK